MQGDHLFSPYFLIPLESSPRLGLLATFLRFFILVVRSASWFKFWIPAIVITNRLKINMDFFLQIDDWNIMAQDTALKKLQVFPHIP